MSSSYASSSSAPWPAFLPPALRTLQNPLPHPNPSKLPPSSRIKGKRTLQDDLDDLDRDEDYYYSHVRPPFLFVGCETNPTD